jgi:hypothetical protein
VGRRGGSSRQALLYSVALALLGELLLEVLPTLLEMGLLGGGRGFVHARFAQQGEAQAVGFMSGVDYGRRLAQAAFAGRQESLADGWALAGGVEANLIERIA